MSTHQYILAQSEGGDQDAARQRFPSLLYVTNAHYSQEWGSQLHSHTCSEMFFIIIPKSMSDIFPNSR